MPTDDQSPIIPDARDYERVTGEFPSLADAVQSTTAQEPTVWERETEQGKQYYGRDHGVCRIIGPAPLPDVDFNATTEQLVMLGFVPCTDTAAMIAMRYFLVAASLEAQS